MAKFVGKIGYAIETEVKPGVWKCKMQTVKYFGDVIRNSVRQSSNSDSINDDIIINNQFSIISDPFANNNFHTMKYIEYMGTKWKITNVEVQYPRLLITVGGVYNGDE